MIEVLWHGRGGQGAFTAARLLGAAASFEEGAYAMAFPSFGPERRGAPMRAFTKFDRAPIGDRSAITQADYVVYLDDTLLGEDWEAELKPGGLVLVNSTRAFDDPRIWAIDANGLSEAILGRAIPNTVFLGAIAALCPQLTPEAAKQAIVEYMPPKLHEKNWRIVDEAVKIVGDRLSDTPRCHPERSGEAAESKDLRDPVPTSSRHPERSEGSFPEPERIRCRLRDGADPDAPSLDPAVFAKNTCFAAGHLVAKNAGWRNVRPVLDAAACTLCLQCYLYCPDGTIFKVRDAAGETVALAIDYDFCKGCGVCARACKFQAIEMIDEAEALSSRPEPEGRSGEIFPDPENCSGVAKISPLASLSRDDVKKVPLSRDDVNNTESAGA